MRRSERRAARIRAEIPIEAVLQSYGYGVTHGADRREQQFPCDLHGDGQDSKPSARCYPESNQWYCWACYTSRDAVATVREKEGVGFTAALELLEQRYRLPPLPWEDEDEDRPGYVDSHGARSVVEGALARPAPTPEEFLGRVARLIEAAGTERRVPAAVLSSYWERHDFLRALLVEGQEPAPEWDQWVWELRAELIAPHSSAP